MIAPTFWTRGPGKKLRGNPTAVALVLYLSTSPATNMIGLFYQPLPMICHDLGLGSEAELRALLELPAVREVVRYDFEAELVWLPEHAREQLGDVIKTGDKRRPSIERELAAFTGHPFAEAFRSRYGAAFSLSMPLPSPIEAPSEGHAPCLHAPVSVSVSRSVSVSGSAEQSESAEQLPANDPVERETSCPLDLLAKLKTVNVHTDLAKALNVDVSSVEKALEEFVAYWTIGAGMGKRRRNWPARARERVRQLANEGRLPAPAETGPSWREEMKAQQQAFDAQRRDAVHDPAELDRLLAGIGRGAE
jgi:hypothetical protein